MSWRRGEKGDCLQAQTGHRHSASLADFLRVWFVLGSAYALLKLAVDLAFAGIVDLRAVSFWELLLIPLGQAGVAYAIRRRDR